MYLRARLRQRGLLLLQCARRDHYVAVRRSYSASVSPAIAQSPRGSAPSNTQGLDSNAVGSIHGNASHAQDLESIYIALTTSQEVHSDALAKAMTEACRNQSNDTRIGAGHIILMLRRVAFRANRIANSNRRLVLRIDDTSWGRLLDSATTYVSSAPTGDPLCVINLPHLCGVFPTPNARRLDLLMAAVARNISNIDPGSIAYGDLYAAMSILPHRYGSAGHRTTSEALGHYSGGHSSDAIDNIGMALFDIVEAKLKLAGGPSTAAHTPNYHRLGERDQWRDVVGVLSGLAWLGHRRRPLAEAVLLGASTILLDKCRAPQRLSPADLGQSISDICHRVGMLSSGIRKESLLHLLRAVYICGLDRSNIVNIWAGEIDDAANRGDSYRKVTHLRAVGYSPRTLSAALFGLMNLSADHEEVSALLLHFSDAICLSAMPSVGEMYSGHPSSPSRHPQNVSDVFTGRPPLLLSGLELKSCLIGLRKMKSNNIAPQNSHWSSHDSQPLTSPLCNPAMVGGPSVRAIVGALGSSLDVSPLIALASDLPIEGIEGDSNAELSTSVPVGTYIIRNRLQDEDTPDIPDSSWRSRHISCPTGVRYSEGDVYHSLAHCSGLSDGYSEVRQLLNGLADKLSALRGLGTDGERQTCTRASDLSQALFGLQRCHHGLTYTYPTHKLLSILSLEFENTYTRLDEVMCNVANATANHKSIMFTAKSIAHCFYGLRKLKEPTDSVLHIVTLLRLLIERGMYIGDFNSIDIGMLLEGLRYLPSRSSDVKVIIGIVAAEMARLPTGQFTAREVTSCLYALQNMDYMGDELRLFIKAVTAILREDNMQLCAYQCATALLSLRLKPLHDECILDLINALTHQISNCSKEDLFTKYDTVDLQGVLRDLRERHPSVVAMARSRQFISAVDAASENNAVEMRELGIEDRAYEQLNALRKALQQKVHQDAVRRGSSEVVAEKIVAATKAETREEAK